MNSIKIISVSGIIAPPFPIMVTDHEGLHRITKVRVNGVPLDVDRTAAPSTR